MGLVEILWTVAGIIVPLLLGTAWAMIGLTPPEFWIARGCIILAAIVFAAVSLYWLVQSTWPIGARGPMAAILGAVTLLVFSEALRWANAREELVVSKSTSASQIDYAYGLVLNAVQPSLDLANKDNALELRPIFANNSNAPLKFTVESLEQKIEEKIALSKGPGTIIPRGGQMTFFPNVGFSSAAYKAFSERATGALEYRVVYGHPDFPPTREASKRVRISLFKKREKGKEESVSLNWIVESETDEPVSSTSK